MARGAITSQQAYHHMATQQDPADLLALKTIARLSCSCDDFVRDAASLVGTFIVSCLRFSHAQRSIFVSEHNGFYTGKCFMGKRRVKGRRPGFDWSIPAVGDFSTCVHHFFSLWAGLQKERPTITFLFPALEWSGRNLSDAQQWLQSPMTANQFRAIACALLAHEPRALSGDDFCNWATYSFRRVLPTCAECLGFSESEASAIGNWVERKVVDWVGFMVDFNTHSVSLTEDKITKIVIGLVSLTEVNGPIKAPRVDSWRSREFWIYLKK